MGIIAACVDWTSFTNKMFKFDSYVKHVYPEINDQGVPTGQYHYDMVENTFNPKICILIGLILIVVFFFIIYIPAKILFEHLESKFTFYLLTFILDKYTPIIARFGLKRITYRKEMKRRGSWPLAYSNQFANFQE